MKLKLLYTNQKMKELNKKLAEDFLNAYTNMEIRDRTGIKIDVLISMRRRGSISKKQVEVISKAFKINPQSLRCDYGYIVEKAVFEKK